MSTCEKCRHWGAERVRALRSGGEMALQARCLVDPARAAPPLMWQEQTCPQFAPELREYPPSGGAGMSAFKHAADVAEVLAANRRTDGRREWAGVGAWLQPGQSIVILNPAETRITILTTDDLASVQTAPTEGAA